MTELNSISGQSEYIKDYHTKEVAYSHNQIQLSAMYGGSSRGRCLQLSIGETNIQLTLDNARKLRDEVIRFCDENY